MKKLKIYVLALFFFSFLKINAGCQPKIYVYKNSCGSLIHTLYGDYPNSTIPTRELYPIDSIIFRGFDGCNGGEIKSIFFNDTLIASSISYFSCVKFLAKPGKYIIFSSTVNGPLMQATLILTNALLHVGVAEKINANQFISLFPNPSKESITINSFEDNLKTVAIYNVNSELIEFIETDSKRITIPLSQYPHGIYIVKVATLSNKIAIKKLIVQ